MKHRIYRLIVVLIVASSMKTTLSGGFERGGTEAGQIFKITAARKKALEILGVVSSNDFKSSITKLQNFYQEENRLRLQLDLIAKNPTDNSIRAPNELPESPYQTVIRSAPADDVFIIDAEGKKRRRVAATDLKPHAEILINETYVDSASEIALTYVILHETVHHLSLPDEFVNSEEGQRNIWDIFAMELIEAFERLQLKNSDQDEARKRLNDLRKELFHGIEKLEAELHLSEGTLPKRLPFHNMPGFDAKFRGLESTNIDSDFQTAIDQRRAPHLSKLRQGRKPGLLASLFNDLTGREPDWFGIADYLSEGQNFQCSARDWANFAIFFEDFRNEKSLHREVYTTRPQHSVLSVIEEYNRKILALCPKRVVETCNTGNDFTSVGFDSNQMHYGYIVNLQGPIRKFGINVNHEFTGIDEGAIHKIRYDLNPSLFYETVSCYVQESSKISQ